MLVPALVMLAVQTAATSGPDALIARLDDASWSEREAATAALRVIGDDAGAIDAAIERALQRDDLSEEQRVRLTHVAMERFRASPLGGLGVSFGPAGEGGVQIQSVVAGFPAAGMLRPGDTILAIGDDIIKGQDHLRAEILSRAPGETLPVLLRRDRTVLELALPLGAYTSLDGAAALDEQTVVWAMRLRHGRRAVGGMAVDGVGRSTTGAAWIAAAFPEGRGETSAPKEPRGPGVADGVIGLRRDAAGNWRSIWMTRDDAERALAEQERADLSRRLTSSVRRRSVLVEFERSLTARAGGAGDADTESRLARVRAEKDRIEAMLGEMSQTPGPSAP